MDRRLGRRSGMEADHLTRWSALIAVLLLTGCVTAVVCGNLTVSAPDDIRVIEPTVGDIEATLER